MIKVNRYELQVQQFPDGTPKLDFNPNWCKDRLSNDLITIQWLYDNDAEFLQLAYIVGHLKNHGFTNIELDIPYIPNARFDRVKSDSEVFTLKHFANLINTLGFQKVTALDPHSYVSEALFNNFTARSPLPYIRQILRHYIRDEYNLVLFFPDEGAMKRYSGLAKELELPFVFGIKNRDWKTGHINGLKIEGEIDNIKDKDILIIDDICSRGGTFYHSAKALKELDVNDIYLYVSHCENTILQGDLISSGLIKQVFTTNSIYREQHPYLITVLKDLP